MDQLFIFSRMFEDAWEFPNSLHEFWELEEGNQPCVLLEMLWEYMVSGPLLWPNQYNHYQSPVHIVGYKSDSFFVTVEQRDCCRLSRFRPQFPWTKFLGAAKRSGVVVTGSWDSPTHTGVVHNHVWWNWDKKWCFKIQDHGPQTEKGSLGWERVTTPGRAVTDLGFMI